MKTKITLTLALVLAALSFAQQGINYKAVIKDNLGNVVVNQSVTIQFTILKGTAQTNVYAENQTATTDANGIVVMNIGLGTPNTGTFTAIDWGNDTHYLNVKINTGNGLVNMGTTQFMAVPYALYAKNVEGSVKKINDLLDGKSDATGSSVFIGVNAGSNDFGTDNENVGLGFQALKNSTSGLRNTAIGFEALYSNTTGKNNTANGAYALTTNTAGSLNTANGVQSMYSNTTGNRNTANGVNTMVYNTTGNDNTANGVYALYANTTGNYNTANGAHTLVSNTSGNDNTANGFQALTINTTGNSNTANGINALGNNTVGNSNSANGSNALSHNTTGDNNTANGSSALLFNTTGNRNTANGFNALLNNTIGNCNTANGSASLVNNTTGSYNTANGYFALSVNTTGNHNTANGTEALMFNLTGSWNTATGYRALRSSTTGSFNTANGREALYSNSKGDLNTAIGYQALYSNTTGNNNTAIGDFAGSQIFSGNNNTAIGFQAQVPKGNGNNQVRIGSNLVSYAGVQVAWTITSDQRLKSKIQASNLGLEFVKALKPVAYERNNDENKKTEYGFIAQEVETTLKQFGATNNGLITVDDEGIYSLRYNDLIAILTKAIQEQQTLIKGLKAEVTNNKSIIKEQALKMEDLTAELELNNLESKAFNKRLEHLETKLKSIY